jgi:hypothetical protein
MVAEEYNCGEEVDLRRIHKEQEKMENHQEMNIR